MKTDLISAPNLLLQIFLVSTIVKLKEGGKYNWNAKRLMGPSYYSTVKHSFKQQTGTRNKREQKSKPSLTVCRLPNHSYGLHIREMVAH